MQVSLEEALEHESTQVRHDGRRDTGEQLGAGNSRHAKLRLDFGQVVQFVAVLETEATLGQFQRASQPHSQAAETALRLIEDQQSLVQIDGAVHLHSERQIVERLARQFLVQQAQPAHIQLARERNPPAFQLRLDGRIDLGVLRLENRGRQDLGDLVEREAFGPQGEGALDRARIYRRSQLASRGPQGALGPAVAAGKEQIKGLGRGSLGRCHRANRPADAGKRQGGQWPHIALAHRRLGPADGAQAHQASLQAQTLGTKRRFGLGPMRAESPGNLPHVDLVAQASLPIGVHHSHGD